jgi:hypothetical protein
MFEFIWHLRGSVPLERDEADTVTLDKMERLLSQQQKVVSARGSGYLTFHDRNPFGASWPEMAIYDHGLFWIERDLRGRSLRYDLRSLHSMVFCSIVSLIFFFLGLGGNGLATGIKLGAWGFFGLYGGNILLALVRVPSTIRKASSTPS